MELKEEIGGVPIVSSIEYDTFGVVIVDNHVVGLGLYDKGLKKLPEIILQLQALKELSLGGNQLTELPETITRMTALKNNLE